MSGLLACVEFFTQRPKKGSEISPTQKNVTDVLVSFGVMCVKLRLAGKSYFHSDFLAKKGTLTASSHVDGACVRQIIRLRQRWRIRGHDNEIIRNSWESYVN